MTMRYALRAALLVLALFLTWHIATASLLLRVSDLISTSAPSSSANHTITFTLINAVPASGKITITPESAFTIPGGLSFSDIDLAVSSGGGPYVDRGLAAVADASNDGVSIVSGASGSITITLSSTSGLLAGDAIQLLIGTNATYGSAGAVQLQNAASAGSYRIRIRTYTAASAEIDYGTAMIAVVLPVGVSATPTAVEPLLFNGLPSGAIAANSATIEISLETDILATCRYATSSGIVYGSMTGSFSPGLGQLFLKTITGHQNNTTYNYYVRCISTQGVANDDDFLITFTLDPDPISNTSIPPANGAIPGQPDTFLGTGGSGVRNGSDFLYLASVTFAGFAPPLSTVYILKDGVQFATVQPRSDGAFSSTMNDLERGAYTISAYSIDSAGRRSAMVSNTLSLLGGTNNTISNVILPPTVGLQKNQIGIGDDAVVVGESVPNSRVDVYVAPQTDIASVKIYSATSTATGTWTVTIPGTTLNTKGTHLVKARSVVSLQRQSDISRAISLGVGVAPLGDIGNRSDLNKDGKVNLVDFSILLSFWNSDDADADINQNGTVGLEDFSIMLFNWTG